MEMGRRERRRSDSSTLTEWREGDKSGMVDDACSPFLFSGSNCQSVGLVSVGWKWGCKKAGKER